MPTSFSEDQSKSESTSTDIKSSNTSRCGRSLKNGGFEIAPRQLNLSRFQCDKSVAILRESTSDTNDFVSQGQLGYLVSATFGKTTVWWTATEMCAWLVQQLSDRLRTKELRVMRKVEVILYELLRCGSSIFAEHLKQRWNDVVSLLRAAPLRVEGDEAKQRVELLQCYVHHMELLYAFRLQYPYISLHPLRLGALEQQSIPDLKHLFNTTLDLLWSFNAPELRFHSYKAFGLSYIRQRVDETVALHTVMVSTLGHILHHMVGAWRTHKATLEPFPSLLSAFADMPEKQTLLEGSVLGDAIVMQQGWIYMADQAEEVSRALRAVFEDMRVSEWAPMLVEAGVRIPYLATVGEEGMIEVRRKLWHALSVFGVSKEEAEGEVEAGQEVSAAMIATARNVDARLSAPDSVLLLSIAEEELKSVWAAQLLLLMKFGGGSGRPVLSSLEWWLDVKHPDNTHGGLTDDALNITCSGSRQLTLTPIPTNYSLQPHLALLGLGRENSSHSSGGSVGGPTNCRTATAGSQGPRSTTFILRRSCSGTHNLDISTNTQFISIDTGMSEAEREDVPRSQVQEDDIVIVCNEKVSCNDPMRLAERFQLLHDYPLGEGSYGSVFRAWDEVRGCYLAVKVMSLAEKATNNASVMREVLHEYAALTDLQHPNIVRVVACMVANRTGRIFMEWLPSGSIFDVLRSNGRGKLSESVVARYARDCLSGLSYLHGAGVIHRDVKPANMLLTSEGSLKLSDFGTCHMLADGQHIYCCDKVVGTVPYMAPECAHGMYSPSSDVWSLGCSVLEMITGRMPWTHGSSNTTVELVPLLFRIGNLNDATNMERPWGDLHALGDSHNAVSGLGDISAELVDFLQRMFVTDHTKRASSSELLHHAFITKHESIWETMQL